MDDTPTPPRRTPGGRRLGIGAAIAALVAAVTAWVWWPSQRGRWSEPSTPPESAAPSGTSDGGDPGPEKTSGPTGELHSGDGADATAPDAGHGPDCSPSCDLGCDKIVSDVCNSITDQVCNSIVDQSCNAVTTDVCSTGSASTFPATGGQFLATATAGVVVMPLVLVDRFAPKTAGRQVGRGRVTARVALAAIGLYRRHLAPRTAIVCRFTPTCSAYGAVVIERHGLIAGARLAMRRIRRCRADVAMGTPDPPP